MGVTYIKREGVNGGMMLDGSMMVDVIAYKAVLTVPLNPMTAGEQSALLDAVCADYVNVRYFDVKTNAYRTAQFIPTIGTTSAVILRAGSAKWFSGLAITFEER